MKLTVSPAFLKDGLDIFSSCYSYLITKVPEFQNILLTLPRSFKANTNYLNEEKKKGGIQGEKARQYMQYFKNMIRPYILIEVSLLTIPFDMFYYPPFPVSEIKTGRDSVTCLPSPAGEPRGADGLTRPRGVASPVVASGIRPPGHCLTLLLTSQQQACPYASVVRDRDFTPG